MNHGRNHGFLRTMSRTEASCELVQTQRATESCSTVRQFDLGKEVHLCLAKTYPDLLRHLWCRSHSSNQAGDSHDIKLATHEPNWGVSMWNHGHVQTSCQPGLSGSGYDRVSGLVGRNSQTAFSFCGPICPLHLCCTTLLPSLWGRHPW